MAKEADAGIQKKISEVESEQGSIKEIGAEPPKTYGHSSAASAGTAGSAGMPGGGNK